MPLNSDLKPIEGEYYTCGPYILQVIKISEPQVIDYVCLRNWNNSWMVNHEGTLATWPPMTPEQWEHLTEGPLFDEVCHRQAVQALTEGTDE